MPFSNLPRIVPRAGALKLEGEMFPDAGQVGILLVCGVCRHSQEYVDLPSSMPIQGTGILISRMVLPTKYRISA
jgi:hypothetical protein